MDYYKDQTISSQERAADLVARMSLEEKISQLGTFSAAIPRLGIPAYNYWSEASHGVFTVFGAQNRMDVTSFPVCLAMSHTWNAETIKKVGTAISDEARVYHNLFDVPLHYFCPTVNLSRDPRNGRNDEAFGEDPFLSGSLSCAYITSMQGEGNDYYKVVCTPKHYALNSSEYNRHFGSSNVDESTLREYYAKVFEYTIKDGNAHSIMTSYNRINGIPASAHPVLLRDFLREEWGFDGFVVSDCGAVADMYLFIMGFQNRSPELAHYYAKDFEEASAMALNMGMDMSCGREFERGLMGAIEKGYIVEDTLDRSLVRIFTTRFKLGLFDDKAKVSYSTLKAGDACSDEIKSLAEDIARESIVLLKNDEKTLPFDAKKVRRVLVVGPNAIYRQLGGYSAGMMGGIVDTVLNVTPLQGIQALAAKNGIEVEFTKGWNHNLRGGFLDALLPGAEGAQERPAPPPGSDMTLMPIEMPDMNKMREMMTNNPPRYPADDKELGLTDGELMEKALKAAAKADAVIIIAGTDATTASEERDRPSLELPYGQDEKIQKLLAANKNTAVVCVTMGPVSGGFIEKTPALVAAYFAGQSQGTAIADVLFGEYNPNGKITQTWYNCDDDLPHISEYGIRKPDTTTHKGRTYWYFTDPVLFPFGHGISYTSFKYANFKVSGSVFDANDTLDVSLDVTNTGNMDGAEIVQLYLRKEAREGMFDNKPTKQLKAYEKVWLKAGETKTVNMSVALPEVTFWSNLFGKLIVENGIYTVMAGASSSDIRHEAKIEVTGKWNPKLFNVEALSTKHVLAVGDTAALSVTAVMEDKTRVCLVANKPVFSSSNESVATVAECGTITAKTPGVATITVAVTVDGVTKSKSLPVAVK